MQLTDDVVDRPAEEGVRLVALALLGEVDEAAARLERRDDPEALHDFRVGLRRTRTALEAFRAWLDEDGGRKPEKKLKRYAKATNAQRDAQVQLAWLDSKRDALVPERRVAGGEYLSAWIRDHAEEPDPQELVARYRRTAEKLRRRLGSYVRRVDVRGAPQQVDFGAALAALLRDQEERLRSRIAAIEDGLDQAGVHRARIAAKRLRYLLEPLRGNRHADARAVVKLLKRLQDVLGDLHDAHVLANVIEEALVHAEGERARRLHASTYGAPRPELGDGSRNPRQGLLAVLKLVRERRDALFADLEHEWRAERLGTLESEVVALAAALEARAGGKLERERRYVLAAVPPHALEAVAVEIDQGWLPGAHVRERIRRIGGPDGERFWRGLEQGGGQGRMKSEEETTREVFDVLWPLTLGRRVSRRRREVADAGLTWEIDEFTDRDLVLAAVELPAGTGHVELPGWLAPLVLRDVTDDPAFQDEDLAVARPTPSTAAPAEDGSRTSTH